MSDTENLREKFKRPLERPGAGAAPSAKPAPSQLPVPVANPAAAPAPDEVGGGGALARLLNAIGRMLAPKPPAKEETPAAAAETPVFTVLIAHLGNDADGAGFAHLIRTLDGKLPFKLRPLGRAFALDSQEDPAAVAAVVSNTRLTAATEKGDLLIWGDMVKEGYRLRFASAAAPDDDRPANFGPATRLELPRDFGEPAASLLLAAALAAAEASTEAQKGTVRRLLPSLATAVEGLSTKPPLSMSMPQQRSLQTMFGHVAAATALSVPPSQSGAWFDKAVGSYRAALKRVSRIEPTWESGLLHKHIAAVLMTQAEATKEPAALLQAAVAEWRSAAENLSRATMPQEWAAAQIRLGNALYRLDLVTGDIELLREALQTLQGALQVYSRTETPQKWAGIMHDIALVLQVYGDQLRSPEVLNRSIEACESVLQVFTRERTPQSWAAAQNTLGSALFLFDKHSDGISHLDAAAAALEQAQEVFQSVGSKAPAQVAARNLAHVRKLAEERRGRQVIDPPGWTDDHRPPPRRR